MSASGATPVDVLIESSTLRSVVMVISLLLSGVMWNLGTWWYGLPVSSSHTLIGSILGVGLANSLLTKGNISGVNGRPRISPDGVATSAAPAALPAASSTGP